MMRDYSSLISKNLCTGFFLSFFYCLLGSSLPCLADEISGDLKLFHLMSGAPRGTDEFAGSSSGALTSRFKLKNTWTNFKAEGHLVFTALGSGTQSTSLFSLSPNLGTIKEALPLSKQVISDGSAQALLRADRLFLSYEKGLFKITLGRQAISFGEGRFFTPLDRVNPFSPATVDREYKPGVDAFRLDGYWGIAGEWTMLIAQKGEWEMDHRVFAARVKDNLFTWDIALSALWVEGDQVLGLSFVGPLAELSFYGDFSYTWRVTKGETALEDQMRGETDPFIRTTFGVDWSWSLGGGGRLNIEFAYLEDGANTIQNYVLTTTDPRFVRGERWLLGQQYLAINVQQALTPLLNGSVSVISNLVDQSTLLGPNLLWSISDEVSASIGGYIGMGQGLENLRPQSEFGTLSWLSFIMMSAYY